MNSIQHNWEIVYTIALMDLKLKYQNSKLGFLWSFLKPLLQFLTYYMVFGVILRVSDSPDYPMRLFLGILLWVFFTEGTSMGLGAYLGKKSIITKIKTEKELLPIAAYVSSAFSFFLNFMVFLVVFHIYTPSFWKIYNKESLLLFLFAFCFLSIFILSLNIILATVNTVFRDLQTIWEIILMYGCYLTPIMYTLPIPEKFLPLYYFVNPLAIPIESMRAIFFKPDVPLWENPVFMSCYIGAELMWVIIAVIVNHKFKNKVADYL